MYYFNSSCVDEVANLYLTYICYKIILLHINSDSRDYSLLLYFEFKSQTRQI